MASLTEITLPRGELDALQRQVGDHRRAREAAEEKIAGLQKENHNLQEKVNTCVAIADESIARLNEEIDHIRESAERQAMQDREVITMLQCDIRNREQSAECLQKKIANLKKANASFEGALGDRARADREEELNAAAPKTSPFSGMQCICIHCGRTYMGGNEELHAAVCEKRPLRVCPACGMICSSVVEHSCPAEGRDPQEYRQEVEENRRSGIRVCLGCQEIHHQSEAHVCVEKQKLWYGMVNEKKAGWEAGGTKHDSGKPRYDLIDPFATDMLAKVLTFGAEKYAAHNWRKGIAYSRLIAAALRHIHAFNEGQDCDNETNLPHAAHAMCCMMFLCWMQYNRSDMDDRWTDTDPSRQPVERKKSLREELAERFDDMIAPDVSAGGIDRGPNPFWKSRSASGDEEPDFIQEAVHHADAIFSQYGVAPRAKKWEPLELGAWKAIKVGDLVKLKGQPRVWRIMELDVENMTIGITDAAVEEPIIMARESVHKIIAVQR